MLSLIDFRTIRPHANTQSRGFEELCWQLLLVLENLPPGATLVRHGAPDGGVEMRATLVDGSVWAWQAKYLFTLGDGEFSQLDRSVQEALNAQPKLVRYTFCLPYDRPAANVEKRKSAMQKWEAHCTKWSGWAKAKGMDVEFHYIGESQLLDALTSPGQEGRVRYWFDVTTLTLQWFQAHVDAGLKKAGPRYTRELNIELPIASVFDGVGRTANFGYRLREKLGDIRKARRSTSILQKTAQESQHYERIAACNGYLDELDRLMLAIDVITTKQIDFPGIATICTAVFEQVEDLFQLLREQAHELLVGTKTSEPSETSLDQHHARQRRDGEALEAKAWELRHLQSVIRDMRDFAEGKSAHLANRRAMLVVGRPGVGKTHLLCDVARLRVAAQQPTVLLFGQSFTRDEPWTQVCNQLHLTCGVDEFLGALNVAAETQNTYALIMLDAINEGEGLDLWPHHLTAFIEKVLGWPRLGIVLTCRTSYEHDIIPETLDDTQLIRVVHSGFAGTEYYAVKEFFRHYALRLPDFPLLMPEFQNPLFLKLMCRALQMRGETSLPRGATGVTEIFDGFLDSINRYLAPRLRCDYAPEERLVWQAVNALAQEMLDTEREWVPFVRAKALLDDLLPHRQWSRSLFHGLLSEGVLMQERHASDSKEAEDVVLFAYQRLGDHQRAALLCEAYTVETLTIYLSELLADPSAAYHHSGLLEALAIQVPERFGRELYQLVPDSQHGRVQYAYLESLIWRKTTAFPDNFPDAYLISIANSSGGFRQTLDVLLHVACIPGHPLNAQRLHRILLRTPMTERDQWWSIEYLQWESYESQETSSPVMRLLHWARNEDVTSCNDDAAVLAALALAWYLTSPNRSLRDEATKALVHLLHQRYDALIEVLWSFNEVDDPYVAERLYGVAYGCCLMDSDIAGIGRIAMWMYDKVFKKGQPPVHLLLRDYARGVIERAFALGCTVPEIDPSRIRPPYRSPWPLRAPSEKEVNERYSNDHSYWTLWSSVMGWDFHRYIIQSSVGHFLAPNQRELKAARRREALAAEHDDTDGAINQLTPEQWTHLWSGEEAEDAQEPVEPVLEQQLPTIRRTLGQFKRTLEHNAPIPFDSGLASRWIFARVLAMGWTPERFARFDDSVNRHGNRSAHALERVGKKYQWIALHELLARISDHCKMQEVWNWRDQKPQWYNGPWEISRRDIDPSLLQRDIGIPPMTTVPCWWVPSRPQFPPMFDSAKREAWLQTDADLPEPMRFLEVIDTTGIAWLMLAGGAEWRSVVPPEVVDPFAAGQCILWYQVHSYLIHRQDQGAFVTWLESVDDPYNADLPETGHAFNAFLGEYLWHPASESLRAEWAKPSELGISVSAAPTSAEYLWEGSDYDASVGEGVSAKMPSSLLTEQLNLHWPGHGLRYIDDHGKLVVWDPSAETPGPSVLLADRERLLRYLDEHDDLTIVWILAGEKQAFSSSAGHHMDGIREIRAVYSLGNNGLKRHLFTSKLLRPDS